MQTDSATVFAGRRATLGDLKLARSGKVRDIYEIDDERLLFVTSDRVSAFDVIMPQGIPHKGRVLTAIAVHWFAETADILPNHLISTSVDEIPGLSATEREELEGRIMIVHRCEPTTVEWVMRGYICGSGWKEYQKVGSICGVQLPEGLQFCERFPEPIFTPTTKDDDHDEPINADQARERVGSEVFDTALAASRALFAHGTKRLAELNILLADTKFEFGLQNGRLLLIDEALTPDSSRFWPADEYRVGANPPSYDKQILRDWLETQDWNKQAPGPDVPSEVLERVSGRYLEICKMITGALPAGVKA